MKRLLLVVDNINWAWGHIAIGIRTYAPDGYDVGITTQSEFTRWMIIERNIDAVLQFSWCEASHKLLCRNTTVMASHGAFHQWPHQTYLDERLATRIRNLGNASRWLSRFDSVLCHTRELESECSRFTKSASYCPPGVDLKAFPFHVPKRKFGVLRVGWCGQRATEGCFSAKGVEMLKQVRQQLSDAGFAFVINDRTAHTDPLSQSEMSRWYRDIDVFICTSVREGGPLTILEALASGRPVITTAVGLSNELVSKRMVFERVPAYDDSVSMCESAERMVELLREMRGLPGHVSDSLARQAREMAETMSWERLSPPWCQAIAG